MNLSRSNGNISKGFTLLEMTVVIMVMLALMGMGLFTFKKMDEWKLGRAASETLRSVYSAQRMYLADNPTVQVNTLTNAMLLPYMPGNITVMPTVPNLKGVSLGFIVNVSPPVINNGSNAAYDPSGSPRDSLWDVGE